ncbi:MAG: FAD-dependent oxidoreductase [Actinomycetota bacterium]|nr:FAD-dependent oxidoreductase [Actinomycetota bacterium]
MKSNGQNRVTVVGAGLAGLAAAAYLKRNGFQVTIVEASERIGGLVTTDLVDGFYLDRGFQVALKAYPELRRMVRIDALTPRAFARGFEVIAPDMSRHPVEMPRRPFSRGQFLDLLANFSVADLGCMAKAAPRLLRHDPQTAFEMPNQPTGDYLRGCGLSERTLEGVARPFLKGVFLDDQLQTPAAMAIFVAHNFLRGSAFVPSTGMAEIPSLVAQQLGNSNIRLGAEVLSVSDESVALAGGEEIGHDYAVLAIKPGRLATLTGETGIDTRCRSTSTHYFASEVDFAAGKTVLVASSNTPVATIAVMDLVAPSYAPKGAHLVSVSSLGMETSDEDAAAFAADALRTEKAELSHLRTYRIDEALPVSFGEGRAGRPYFRAFSRRVYLAGDFMENPSIDGALRSGRLAAEAVMSARWKSHRGDAPPRNS